MMIPKQERSRLSASFIGLRELWSSNILARKSQRSWSKLGGERHEKDREYLKMATRHMGQGE